MKIKIDTKPEVTFIFSAEDYFLVLAERYKGQPKEWSLNSRIDRSEKGKDDDVADATLYISEEQAQILKDAGFTWITL